jgi:hypothetical protein
VRQVEQRPSGGFSIADSENELAKARLAFGQDLREAAEVGSRATQRLLVPALWGAALVGGAVALFAVARLVRRRHREQALIRIVVGPPAAERSWLGAAGAALARLALERVLESASSTARASLLTSSVPRQLSGAQGVDDHPQLDSSCVQGNSKTNGRETIDEHGF